MAEGGGGRGDADWKNAKSIYEFQAKDIDGNEVTLDKYKGNVCLVVNVASQWGFTGQYTNLQALHDELAEKGLRILGFPCNQFNKQEPWSEEEIKQFVTGKFKVKFDLFSKIDVNGNDAHPLYKYLKMKQGGWFGSGIKWNFTKFLCTREGIPVARYAPTTNPKSIKKDIEKYLSQGAAEWCQTMNQSKHRMSAL